MFTGAGRLLAATLPVNSASRLCPFMPLPRPCRISPAAAGSGGGRVGSRRPKSGNRAKQWRGRAVFRVGGLLLLPQPSHRNARPPSTPMVTATPSPSRRPPAPPYCPSTPSGRTPPPTRSTPPATSPPTCLCRAWLGPLSRCLPSPDFARRHPVRWWGASVGGGRKPANPWEAVAGPSAPSCQQAPLRARALRNGLVAGSGDDQQAALWTVDGKLSTKIAGGTRAQAIGATGTVTWRCLSASGWTPPKWLIRLWEPPKPLMCPTHLHLSGLGGGGGRVSHLGGDPTVGIRRWGSDGGDPTVGIRRWGLQKFAGWG
jgi:hypothetical protein